MVLKLRRFLDDIIDMIYPRAVGCVACGRDCSAYNRYGFCDICFKNLPFILEPTCNVCGRHLKDITCTACLGSRHIYNKAVSVFEYSPPIIDMIYKFKYKNYKALAQPMSTLMAEAVDRMDWEFDAIVPVPLHKNRLELRGYNQAKYLADGIGKILKRPVMDGTVKRVKDTPSQTGLDRSERMWNLYKAFEVVDHSVVEGLDILLVDDVLTTGSTADSCADALYGAGAGAVKLVTFAVSSS